MIYETLLARSMSGASQIVVSSASLTHLAVGNRSWKSSAEHEGHHSWGNSLCCSR